MADEQTFPHPLNEWIDREVDVPVMEGKLNSKGELVGIEQGTTKRKVKTMYSKVPPVPFSCKDGTHKWRMIDKRRHVASCGNCPKNRFLRAAYERIDENGVLRDRDTNEIID